MYGCAGEPSLVEVPAPPLDGFEPAVVERIEAARDAVTAAGDRPARGAAYGELGRLYHAHEVSESAAAAYANAAALSTEDPRWDYYLARVRRDQGRLDESADALERVTSVGLDPAPELAVTVLAGELAFDRERLDEARAAFERALELDADCTSAHVGLGRIAEAAGDSATAAGHFERALELVPEAGTVHYMLGRAYQSLGRDEEAKTHLSQSVTAVRRDLSPPDPWMDELRALKTGANPQRQAGDVAFQAGEYAAAIERYREALAVDPRDSTTHANLGSALTMTGDRDGARAAYRRALELDPAKAAAHFGLGVLDAGDGDDEAAVGHYDAILERDPQNTKALFNRANASSRLGRYDAARSDYAKVFGAEPANGAARAGHAIATMRLGRWADALSSLEVGHAALPDEGSLTNLLARVLVAAPDTAVRDGARGVQLAQRLVDERATLDHVETLAMAHAELGAFDLAVRWQRAAIDAARAAGRADHVVRLEARAEAYERGEPCREPLGDPRALVTAAGTGG